MTLTNKLQGSWKKNVGNNTKLYIKRNEWIRRKATGQDISEKVVQNRSGAGQGIS